MKCKYCNDDVSIFRKLSVGDTCSACSAAEEQIESEKRINDMNKWDKLVKNHKKLIKEYKKKNELKGIKGG